MPKRRPPQEFIRDITKADDGIRPVRSAHDWTREKLGILTSYCAAYARACSSAKRFYFVDAMAGPGLYHIEETAEWLLGSTPIALQTIPRFTSVLSIELDAASARALRERTVADDNRRLVIEGDVNEQLATAILEHIPHRAPTFVLLDPEGAELLWSTVVSASQHRLGGLKTELLILFATEGVNRMLPVEANIELHNEMRLNLLFPPNSGWRDIWMKRRERSISPADARQAYVEAYADGLRQLGYRFVEHRRIERTTGALVYHLVFATDHEAGQRIMSDVFGAMRPNEPQLRML